MHKEVIANIKSLGIDMINKSGVGHPGIVLGAAPIIYTLYANHLNINPKDPNYLNRDRFVLSAGHGSALLYATLHMAGYDISLDDLKSFRTIGSITPGHPEYKVTPGVEATTGPLGQGFASAVGMAIAQKHLQAKYTVPNNKLFGKMAPLFNYKVYVLAGDGDLMEGITHEASSLAGTLALNNLIVLYDSNNVSLDGSTSLSFKENVLKRYEALGWNTILVKDGTKVSDIDEAISRAKTSSKPTIIEVKTTIGLGSKLAGTSAVHGKNLEADDIANIKLNLGVGADPFYINEVAKMSFSKKINDRSSPLYIKWQKDYEALKEQIEAENNKQFIYEGELDGTLEMRQINSLIMNQIADQLPNFMSGSADLSSSTLTALQNKDIFTSQTPLGTNIYYGVREHAMGAISNGLALSNIRSCVSTFLTFADYLKPALRLSALMHLPNVFIFTHDSITIGSDGPTHQSVEQLAMLRSIPNVTVYRPADAKELLGAWDLILKNNSGPSVLIVSKSKALTLDTTSKEEVAKGAYTIRNEKQNLHGIIIATGLEVSSVYLIANQLYEERHLDLRVVSMPSMELFLKMPLEYQKAILPIGVKIVVVEAASSFGWHRFVYNDNYLITVNNFGQSGSSADVVKHFGFDHETLKERLLKLFK